MMSNPKSKFSLQKNDPDWYLARKFLIATPGMQDKRFSQTVILMCMHDEDQAMGIIINKPKVGLRLSEMLSHLEVSGNITNEDAPVLYGGPVETERGFVLHSSDFSDTTSTLPITETLVMNTSKSVLSALTTPDAPKRAVLALGCAGWYGGQLEAEIAHNSWLVSDVSEELVFSGEYEQKWKQALGLLGITPELFSASAGNA